LADVPLDQLSSQPLDDAPSLATRPPVVRTIHEVIWRELLCTAGIAVLAVTTLRGLVVVAVQLTAVEHAEYRDIVEAIDFISLLQAKAQAQLSRSTNSG
jgi:hypothetical protein